MFTKNNTIGSKMNDCGSFAGKLGKFLRKSVKILDQMRKLRLKTFENIRKRLKIFENIRKIARNVRKYSIFFDFFAGACAFGRAGD